jgi:tetratricopeptide (TPR) repeat protein
MKLREQIAAWLNPPADDGLSRAGAALETGRTARRAGQTDAALAALDQALAETTVPSERAVILYERFETLLDAGRLTDASAVIALLHDLNNVAAAATWLYLAQGRLALETNDLTASHDAFEKAEKGTHAAFQSGLEGRATAYRAELYLRENSAGYAVQLLNKALPMLSANGDLEGAAYFNGILGEALIQNGQEAEGAQALGKALELADRIGYRQLERRWSLAMSARAYAEARYYDAQTHSERALQSLNPDQPDAEAISALNWSAKINLALGKSALAVDQARRALANAQLLGDMTLTHQSEAVLGAALRNEGRTAEAVEMLRAASAADDAPPDVLRQLGGALADSGAIDEAIDLFNRVIKMTAGTLDEGLARRDLGLALQKAGRLNDAISAWSAALPIFEDSHVYALLARLYCDMGSARRALGQQTRALKEIEQALMLLNRLGEHEADTRGIVLSNAANAYAESGEVESADAFFDEAISLAVKAGDKAAESTRNGNYGWFLVLLGRPRRAISMLERAIKLSQSLGLTVQEAVQTDNLGLAYDSMGDLRVAADTHREALTLIVPLNQPFWKTTFAINLANSLIALSEADEAAVLLETALAEARRLDHPELIILALTAQARLRLLRQEPDSAVNEAITLARRGEYRRLLAEALAVHSQCEAANGRAAEAQSAWEEAVRLYSLLHMPQAKISPAWLV